MRLLATLGILLWAAAATAETIALRSGEHDGFSRLVLDATEPGGWTLGRSGDGYLLRLDRAEADFDLSGVYRLIPRDRLAMIAPGPVPGTLRLTVRCRCHAKAFETAEGRIVIDIADGPPPQGSPFERDLDAPATKPETVAEPGTAAGGGEPMAQPVLPVAWVPYRSDSFADPRLGLFQRAADAARPRHPPGDPVGDPADGPPPQQPQPVQSAMDDAARSPDPAPEGAGTAAAAPAPIADFAPDLAIGAPADLPDPRAAETEAALLLQLSRAASQGLIEAARPGPELPKADFGAHGGTATDASAVATARPGQDPVGQTLPEAPAVTADHLAVHARTSIDRDMLLPDPSRMVTANGLDCYPDARLAPGDWGDDRPAAIQIADRRGVLVGEFDRPAPEAVLSLSRLYLHFGFGAEARVTLNAFGQDDEESRLLRILAVIVDGDLPDAASPLAGMTDCDGNAALWAVLARRDLPAAALVDSNAVLRGFSSLPAPLRRSLGGTLADRFLAAGQLDTARALRDAIARAPVEAEATIGMIDARLDLAMGRAEAGEAGLDRIAGTNDPTSPEALILAIRSRLDRGEPVSPSLADAAEALAFERRDSPQGADLIRAAILARAAVPDFDRAFLAFHRDPKRLATATGATTLQDLFAMLARTADDETFLRHAFADLAPWEATEPDADSRIAIAGRLAALGFGAEARRVLQGPSSASPEAQLILAQAALAEFDANRAIAAIAGRDDPASAAIRARALALTGDHRGAAASLIQAGDLAAAADQAWRGADWPEVARIGPQYRRAALRSLGLVETPGAGTPAEVAQTTGQDAAGQARARRTGTRPAGARPGLAGPKPGGA